eukprot:TRINITY_DN39787_c0_g1_i1.p1 TRINITY_DN39787_c0_g1~~TRINITY_DN39787_c0_g1_i1.p1  ORF type:complete len:238 (+),score=47.61 TRINITY_DN39787_c0_g1_i1:23-715(+)
MLRIACFCQLVSLAQSAYFMVEEGSEKCFQQDVLGHQVLRIIYSMNDKEVLHMAECRILVKNPAGEVVKDHALTDVHEGALAHVPKVEGMHSICVHCAGQGGFFGIGADNRKLRWSIAFDVLGATGSGLLPDPKNLASLSQVKDTQASVDVILERLNAISTENEYEKTFEAKFVKASEAVNTDVAAFKFLQILLITGVAAFQIHNLAKFLHKNKFLDCCLPMVARAKPTV